MKHKTVHVTGIKTSGLAEGEFIGYASTFGNVDLHGDRILKGAFAKAVAAMDAGDVTPILWAHKSDDPKAYVGEIRSARETDEGLEIHGALDLDTEEGRAAYRSVKSRRIRGLSIGYGTRQDGARKAADGVRELLDLDLMEVSLVARGANPEALITGAKSTEGAPSAEPRNSPLVLARKAIAAAETKAADDEDAPAADDADLTVGERLVAALESALEAAREIVSAAEDEDRDLTEDEAAEVGKQMETVRKSQREIASWNASPPEARHGTQYLADCLGRGMASADFHAKWADDSKFTPVQIGTKTTRQSSTKAKEADMTDKFLALGGHQRKASAAAIMNKASGESWGTGAGTTGAKALVSAGQVTTDIPVAPNVVPVGRPATSLLDVIPTATRATPVYRYIRQTSRNLAAAAVAPGAVKPISALATETVDNQVSVIAHLSDPVDKFVLADAPQLQRFVADEMLYGLDVAIQAQALSGDGSGANQTGILATSGVQTRAFATDVLTTIRKAITAAEALGYAPSILAIHPTDWEAVELLATTAQAIAFRGVPIDQGERKIWGLTAVLSTQLPAKTAVVMDPAAMSIDTIGGVEIEVAKEGGELFARNQVQIRMECRIGVSIYQPAAITRVATAA